VFDGSQSAPYLETDRLEALNVYGETKIVAEQTVLTVRPEALVIRPGKILAADGHDSLGEQLRELTRGKCVRVANDIRFSPTFLPDLVDAALDLLIDEERGVWHLANSGAATPEELLIAAAELADLDRSLIQGVPAWSLHRSALRPRNRVLQSERGELLSAWREALHRFVPEVQVAREGERAFALL